MIDLIEQTLDSLPGILSAIIVLLLVAWAFAWFLVPFYIIGTYEKSKEINKKFDRLLKYMARIDSKIPDEENEEHITQS